jgi:hypothetical protein
MNLDFSIDSILGIVGYYYKNIGVQIPFNETTFITPPWLKYVNVDENTIIKAKKLSEGFCCKK